jgi:hypothetical protein
MLVVLAAVLAAPPAAFAHRLLLAATAGPAEVQVKVTYDDGEPGDVGTKVTLTDAAGAVVAAVKTDDAGVCRFPRPKPGTYTLTADDGAGHRATIPLVVADEPVAAGSAERNRWLMSAVGLAVIAGGTALARWLLRRRSR